MRQIQYISGTYKFQILFSALNFFCCYIIIFLLGVMCFVKCIKQIGEICGLLPAGVNIMALSATAACTIRCVVSKRLSLHTEFIHTSSSSMQI